MRQGKIIESGTCEQVLMTPKMDYTKLLLQSVSHEMVAEEICRHPVQEKDDGECRSSSALESDRQENQ